MVNVKKLKFLRNYYNLSAEVAASFLELSLEDFLQAENGEIAFDVFHVDKMGTLFLQSYSELLDDKNPLTKKVLPYSFKDITDSDCAHIFNMAQTIMSYKELIEKYNDFATQTNKTRLNAPIYTEKQFYQIFENSYEDGVLDLIIELPKIKNFTLLIKDMKGICESFSYNINSHYIIAVDSNLTKEKANYVIAKELVYAVLIQKRDNNLTGVVKTESLVNYAEKMATKLLLNESYVMSYVKNTIKSYLFNEASVLKIAKHFVVEPYKINELLNGLTIESEEVKSNGESSLKVQGFKNYAHGEYHTLVQELYDNDEISSTIYQLYRGLGGGY